jgi:hypothetical protein
MQDSKTLLIDTRYTPWSRNTPEWRKESLQAKYGERYRFAGKFLGNVNYSNGGPIRLANPVTGIKGLTQYLNEGHDIIILCGCPEFELCHRKVIVDLLKGAMPDVEVVHPGITPSPGMGFCISIMEPWYWIIMNGKLLQEHGIPPKLIENRTWTTKYRGSIFLRAGSFDSEFFEKGKLASSSVWHAFSRMIGDDDARKIYGLMPKNKADYVSGGVAGQCNLVDVLDWHDDGDWKVWEQYGLQLADIKEMPFVQIPGKFKLFEIPVCHCCSMPAPDHISEMVGEGDKAYGKDSFPGQPYWPVKLLSHDRYKRTSINS